MLQRLPAPLDHRYLLSYLLLQNPSSKAREAKGRLQYNRAMQALFQFCEAVCGYLLTHGYCEAKGYTKVGIKDSVSFGVGDFVLVFHNFFPPSMYFSIAVRLIVHRRSSNNFSHRKDTVYKEIIRTLLLSEKSSDYLNLV